MTDKMDSEVAQLMPNLQQLAFASPGTEDLQKYLQVHSVLADRQNWQGVQNDAFIKPRLSKLDFRPGTGRMPVAKRFCIRIKTREVNPQVDTQDHTLDPQEVKEAILGQALQQRRNLLSKSLRQGSGRMPQIPRFGIVIPVHVPTPEPVVQLVKPQELNATQLATAKTPGASTFFSPMEGIPERISSRHARRRSHAAPSLLPQTASPALGFTPMEGVPELRQAVHAPRDMAAAVGSNLFAGRSPQEVIPQTDAVAQIGVSLHSSGGNAAPAPVPVQYDDDDDHDMGGFDDYGWDGGADDDGMGPLDDGDGGSDPGPRDPTPKPAKAKRVVRNPWARLNKMHARKSLVIDRIGFCEVAPGVRRSTRRSQEPLKWWLGEAKNFGRHEHKTMPTIESVTHKVPNTPWRMVPDIPRTRGWKGGKKRKEAAAPANLDGDDAPALDRQQQQVEVERDEDAFSDRETESLNHDVDLTGDTPGVQGPSSETRSRLFITEGGEVPPLPLIC